MRFLIMAALIGGVVWIGWNEPLGDQMSLFTAGGRSVPPSPSPNAQPPRATLSDGSWMWEKNRTVLDAGTYDYRRPGERRSEASRPGPTPRRLGGLEIPLDLISGSAERR